MRTFSSMRPVSQIALDMELVFLSVNARIVRRFCEPTQITALFTDAVHWYPSKCQREKLKQACQGPRHPDGSQLFRLKDATPRLICST